MTPRTRMPLTEIPTLLTERLRLRAWRPEDLPAFAAYYASARSRFTGGPLDANRAWRKLAYLMGHWRLLGHGGWALEERSADGSPGRVIGTCGIFHPAGKPEPELGWLAYEDGEGRGLMAEAARAVLADARDRLGLKRVVSYIAPANERSRALAVRLGATNEGHCAAYSGSTGQDHDAWAHDTDAGVPAECGEPTPIVPAPTLHTERLLLRGWRASDIDRMALFYADPVSQFVGGPMSPEEVWRQVASYVGGRDMRGYGIFALEERETGAFVGYCGPYYPPLWPEPEIAWGLMPEAHGKGYATEAAARALRHAREHLGWETAISAIEVTNIPSQRVAERLGAVRESERRVVGASGFDAIIFRHPSPLAAHLNAGTTPVHA